MDGLWIPITLAAAFAQNVRSALQKHLKGTLGTAGATWVRFLYAVPFAVLWCAGLVFFGGAELPRPTQGFALAASAGAVAQIVATALLIHSFSYRNFAVGTAFSKTEAVQAALFGIVLLGDTLSPGAAAGIAISLVGVLAISLGSGGAGFDVRAAAVGLGSGAAFALSAVCYRAASRGLATEGALDDTFLVRAALTLVAVTILQMLLMAAWIGWRTPAEIGAVLRHWRIAGVVGLAGAVASVGWFTAMTIENVAHVRALGQVELAFTLLASWFVFGERSTARELIGVAAIVAGLLVLLLAP